MSWVAWPAAVKRLSDRPHVTVSRGRKLPAEPGAHIHFAQLSPDQVRDGVTCEEVTLAQCLRTLPFDEALAVADSALRDGLDPGVLRALDVPGLSVRPQVVIREPGLTARPDLVDIRLRTVLEADSFEWHGGRSALARDARRYNLLTVHGWLVLRFAWEQVMRDPQYVREVLLAAVPLAELMNEGAGKPGRAACG